MKAVGYKTPSPIEAADSLIDIELPKPAPEGRDILVEVKAVSVNPVDYKVRSSTPPADGVAWKVIGWDAAGVVSPAMKSGMLGPLQGQARTPSFILSMSVSSARSHQSLVGPTQRHFP
jgi:NADPH:quinone reductase-like Zn-dependent oxidoreductase